MPDFRNHIITFFVLTFLSHFLFAQQGDAWEILADTQFEKKYFEEEEASFLAPSFGPLPKSYEGKSFTITGFMIPLDPVNDEFILSKYPFASCFFCGGAGPESVLELTFAEGVQRDFQLDDYLTFKGKLVLNDIDIFRMNFILEEAVKVE
ncbi:MAG: DUF3299 domain-containing protein [Bacteroidota bacterium]